MSEADFYKPYRQAMMTALQVGNNKKADFIAGKLLTVDAYKKDETMLFGAMMAANEVGNIPRRDMLRIILTTEVPRAPENVPIPSMCASLSAPRKRYS